MKAVLVYSILMIGLVGCGNSEKAAVVPAESTKAIDTDIQPTTFDSVQALAMKGNYQAQRNLAYGYADHSYQGQDKNPILGCAWYKLVIKSGSDKVNAGDIGNIQAYCNKLSPLEQEAAEAQSVVLHKKIYSQ
ncbi:MAG: hypothetical protein Q7R66_18715 [Undibacterium sp.]|uniref:hypothetical protein n=1 Tax=Undibacterium sp. TaxID=1914977 RepID=UPI00271DCD20|nr:hypothetical protein [Undibacterium sp.]MDO8654209.1 hypothetical protein [Undibacterium sp.]